MKLIRKGITAIFAIMFLAALGVMAVGCSGNKITLSFVVNGGPNSIDSMMVEPGSQVTLPDPEWEGHEFEGWYIHPELTGEMYRDKITAPKTNTTYYAKWSDTIQVTLDPAGGTLSETKFSLKAGASLYNELKKYVPQHENRDLQFGAWFLDGQEVTQNTKVSSSVTVVARYKVSYTVQYYLQNYELSAFELDGSRQVSGTEYVGTPVTAPTTQINGFLFDENQPGNVTQLAQLSEHASENVMSLYYRRGTYVLEYNSNAPEEHAVSGTPYISRSYLFGTKVTVEQNFFTVPGCRFAGWSTTADGAVAYKPEDEMTLNGRTVLYAVWDIGNSDMSGSGDYVFFPRDNQNEAILNRGGYEFVGTRNGDNFTISHSNKEYKGSVSNGYFALTSSDLQGDYVYIDPYYQYKKTLTQSDSENKLIDEKMTLTVESDMSAEFKNNGSNRYPSIKEDAEFKGNLVPYAGGYALLMQNGAYPFILNFVENPDLDEAKNESEKYFTIRGFEANQYFEMALSLENFQTYPEYLVTLDGYGKITMYDHQNDKTIPGDYYAIENRSIDDGRGGIIYFSNIIHAKFDGNDFGENQSSEAEFNFVTYMIVNPDGSTLYVFVRQNTDMAGTLKEKNGSDGATGTLTLDGFGVLGEAIYKANGTDVTKKGTYSFTISNHEGLYLAMEIEQEGSSRTTTEWFRVEFNDGETTDETEFIGTFEKVTQGPGEEFLMLLKSEDRDGEEAKVTFGDYSMTIDGSHTTRIYKKEENSKTYSKLAATGRVQTTDSSTNAYHNTWKFTRDGNANESNGDDQNVPNEFNFTLYEMMIDDGEGNMRSVFVSTDWDGKTSGKKTDIAIEYTDEGGLNRTLSYIETGTEYAGTTYKDELGRIFNGGLIINGEGQSFFSDEQHKIALLVWYDNVTDTQNPSFKFYTMSLDETNKTFLVVGDEKPLCRITPEGEIDEDIVLATRGDTEAILIDEDGTKHLGTLTSEPKSDLGSKVYKVEFDDDTEDLYYSVTTYTSGGYEYECWFAYHQAMDGDFVVGDDETFTTDGYDHATFETGSYSTSGTFYCDETDSSNIVVYYTGSDGKSTFTYMFLFNGSAFIKIDNAYIGHSPLELLDSDQNSIGYKVSFDGRGVVILEKDDHSEKITGTYIMGTGLYLECNVKFSQDFNSHGREFIIAFLSDVEEDGKIERKCIIKDKDGERSYADDDMNVIYLNGYGTVEYHYADGTYQTGTYKVENNTIEMEFEINGEKITKTATVNNQSMSFTMTGNGENKA